MEKRKKVNETKFGSAALIPRLQWVSHRAGWRLFVASVPTRPGAVQPTSGKTKQKKGDAGGHHFTPPSLPSLQYPAFIPHPISSQLKASFVFHLLPRPGLVHLRWLSDVLKIFLESYYLVIFGAAADELSRTTLSKLVILEIKVSVFNKSKYQATHLHLSPAALIIHIIVPISMFRCLPLKHTFQVIVAELTELAIEKKHTLILRRIILNNLTPNDILLAI